MGFSPLSLIMPTLPIWFIFLFLTHATSFQICESTSCERYGPAIQFPFQLREPNQSGRCGYPGFELSCNNRSQTLLTLPNAGDLVVKRIAPNDQKVWINDPDDCLPRRFLLGNINLTGSPFRFSDEYSLVNLTFLNCSSNITELYPLQPITCLSTSQEHNYSVVAMLSDPPFSTPRNSWCQVISSALVPFSDTKTWIFWMKLNVDMELQWSKPHCGHCAASGGNCGFLEDTGLDLACYYLPGRGEADGLSKSGKYGIALGLGIPGVLCTIGLVCFFCGNRERGQARLESNVPVPQPSEVEMGLDGATIEKYPKTQVGESGRLPKPNDNICSICLSEYQPKDTLRTIPECNHYFHADCIDGWLKMNATCPLCRNSPQNFSSFSLSSNSL